MLEWLLITSMSLLSTSILLFSFGIQSKPQQGQNGQETNQIEIFILVNMLSLVYLLISPAALIYLRKNYTKVVKVATVMAASASIGRSLTGDDQILNLIMTAVLSVAFMPIVVAPFGLLDLFAYSEISYAASIPLLLPSIGNSLCQVFRSSYITEITDQLEGQHLAQSQSDDWSKTLAIILAVISTVSAIASYLLLNELKGQVKQANDYKVVKSAATSIRSTYNQKLYSWKQDPISEIKTQLKNFSNIWIFIAGWGLILGLGEVYNDSITVYLQKNQFSYSEIAYFSLFSSLFSLVLSGFMSWHLQNSNTKSYTIIFGINISGCLAALFFYASVRFDILPEGLRMIFVGAYIISGIGFLSFIPLSFKQTYQIAPPVTVSIIYFFFANLAKLSANLLIKQVSLANALSVLPSFIWICLCILTCEEKRADHKPNSIKFELDIQSQNLDGPDKRQTQKFDNYAPKELKQQTKKPSIITPPVVQDLM